MTVQEQFDYILESLADARQILVDELERLNNLEIMKANPAPDGKDAVA